MNSYPDCFSIKNKKIILTGGSKGLGYGMAMGLCQAGAEVVIVGSSDKTFDSAKKLSTETGKHVHAVKGDLSDVSNIPDIYTKCLTELEGRVDVLVNNAGMQYRCKAVDFPLEKWEQIINLNLTAMFAMSQQAARTMITQGRGKIINIASMTSFFGSVLIPAYSSSKGGVAQLTKALSNEWASEGICVNAIAPGYMVTELTSDMKEKNPVQYEEVTSRIPMHRWGKPEDLVGLAIFLSSMASDYITGAVIPVDGGYLGK